MDRQMDGWIDGWRDGALIPTPETLNPSRPCFTEDGSTTRRSTTRTPVVKEGFRQWRLDSFVEGFG